MTVIYSGQRYFLTNDSVSISSAGEDPREVDVDSLPLPVARALVAWRASAGRS